MFQISPTLKNKAPIQSIDTMSPPYYFRHRNRCLPCQIIEVHHNKVRVAFRDKQGRPLESWEHARNVLEATISMQRVGEEPSTSLTM